MTKPTTTTEQRPWTHPLWCTKAEGSDDGRHYSRSTSWKPDSDDVHITMHATRWDELLSIGPNKGSQDRSAPKVELIIENTAMVNLDGSHIAASVHLSPVEARRLIHFLERHVREIEHFADVDVPDGE